MEMAVCDPAEPPDPPRFVMKCELSWIRGGLRPEAARSPSGGRALPTDRVLGEFAGREKKKEASLSPFFWSFSPAPDGIDPWS